MHLQLPIRKGTDVPFSQQKWNAIPEEEIAVMLAPDRHDQYVLKTCGLAHQAPGFDRTDFIVFEGNVRTNHATMPMITE
jgi:hypothetical protein